MSGENMVMLVTKNPEPEVVGVRDIDKIVVAEETIRGYGPTGLRFLLLC